MGEGKSKMKRKTWYTALIVTFVLTSIVNHSVYANEWEDDDGPIDF